MLPFTSHAAESSLLSRHPPKRKVGADNLRRRCVDRHEAAVLLQHRRRVPLRMVRRALPADKPLLAEAQYAAALLDSRLVLGEATQNLEHRIDRVMLGRVGVGRARLDVLKLPVPVPVRERMRLKPRKAVVQTGGHTPLQVRQAQGNGCGGPGHGLLQHGVDRHRREA